MPDLKLLVALRLCQCRQDNNSNAKEKKKERQRHFFLSHFRLSKVFSASKRNCSVFKKLAFQNSMLSCFGNIVRVVPQKTKHFFLSKRWPFKHSLDCG